MQWCAEQQPASNNMHDAMSKNRCPRIISHFYCDVGHWPWHGLGLECSGLVNITTLFIYNGYTVKVRKKQLIQGGHIKTWHFTFVHIFAYY